MNLSDKEAELIGSYLKAVQMAQQLLNTCANTMATCKGLDDSYLLDTQQMKFIKKPESKCQDTVKQELTEKEVTKAKE